ncbi:hypothetical protein GWI72_13460 [Microvirga tunisiensis]|uniref:Uncharacterized protein n=1 Tax=Pannonibacter tanglangensis TaxID=2750084 RepID=A0A7X5F3U1_9HYPH|nr:hypothetical protein [Pannonibacter sp. XCT-53]NBN79280.1 hypothetical protein [Pannonibacter sp. XCT-53]
MFALLRGLLRLFGYFLLGVAVVAAVVDGSKSIAATAFAFTPLRQVWSELSAASLQAARASVEAALGPAVWELAIETLLGWPVWLVLPPLAVVFLILGTRRRVSAALA